MNAPTYPHRQYSLRCPNSHTIPLPRPSRVGIDGNLQEIKTENRKAIFVCQDCGLLSDYYAQDILESLAGTSDPFAGGECRLVPIDVECDDKSCGIRTLVHTIAAADSGKWNWKVAPRDWRIPDSVRCANGDKLRFGDKIMLHVGEDGDDPF